MALCVDTRWEHFPVSVARRRRQRGAALVEAAFIFVPTIILFLTMLYVGIALLIKASLTHAAREGARYAITYQMNGETHQDVAIKKWVVRQSMNLARQSDITINYYDKDDPMVLIPYPNGNDPSNIVEVSINNVTWTWIAPAFMGGAGAIHFSSRSADRMEGLGAGGVKPPR